MNKERVFFRKRRIPMLLIAFVIVAGVLTGDLFEHGGNEVQAAPAGAQMISAPDVDLQMYLWLEDGRPYYSIVFKDQEIVRASRIGLETSLGSLSKNFTGIRVISSDSGDSTWSPLVGEKAEIQDKYNAKTFQLEQSGGLSLAIEMRAYNTGVAFRYLLPDASDHGNYRITEEQTRFDFAPEGIVLCHENGQQQTPSKYKIGDLQSKTSRIYPPLTAVFDDGPAVTLALSKLNNYAYSLLKSNAEGRLKPEASTVNVTEEGPEASPYWTFVVGENLAELPVNKEIILNLNDAPDEDKYQFSEWVKPGKALMMGMFNETTESMKLQIDTAKKCGLQYLLMDFGWYGPEFAKKSDPRLDPEKLQPDPNDSPEIAAAKDFMRPYVPRSGVFDATGRPFNVYEDCPWGGNIQMAPSLDIPEIVKYANSQGVGIFLYVNDVQLNDKLNRFEIEELFEQFVSWGVSGVKPGFVPDKTQEAEKSTRRLVEIAAKYKLMLTVHDEWAETGISRQYPNLLSAEGVLGDEGLRTYHVEGDVNALFSRGIQGFADHTTCYPGKASRGYQLASAVLWPTGLNCLYWPWANTDTNNRATIESLPAQEREFWKYMPATWDELVILNADLSESAATARRTGDEWYLGGISAASKYLKLPLDFLTQGDQYVAEIYFDRKGNNGNNSNRDNHTSSAELLFARYKVDSNTIIGRQMEFGTGIAVHIRPLEAGDENLPDYTSYHQLEDLVNTCEQLYPDVYSPSSWETFESALRKARTYVGGEVHADNELLKQVYTTLINAYEGLVKLAEPMIADADGDVTIQSWINSSANEQKRNYGGAGILRLLSMPSGVYGKYGESENTVDVYSLDAKISLIRFNIEELKADRKLVGGKLYLTYNGLKTDNGKTQTSLAAARVIDPYWTEGTGNDGGDKADGVMWHHLRAGQDYHLKFDMDTLCESEPFALSSPSGTRITIDVSKILEKAPKGEKYISFALFETAGAEIQLYSREGAGESKTYRPTLALQLGATDSMEVKDVSVYDSNNQPLTSLTSDTMKTELTVWNGYSGETAAIMSVAVYAPDGKLVHLERENKSIRAFTKTVCQVEVHMPENVQGQYAKNGYYAKVYLWESGTGKPLTEGIHLFK